MTYYEEYLAHKAHAQAWRDLWVPPLDTAVLKVDVQRPMLGHLKAINMPRYSGSPVLQNLAALQQRAAAIRHQLDLAWQTKDRGS